MSSSSSAPAALMRLARGMVFSSELLGAFRTRRDKHAQAKGRPAVIEEDGQFVIGLAVILINAAPAPTAAAWRSQRRDVRAQEELRCRSRIGRRGKRRQQRE